MRRVIATGFLCLLASVAGASSDPGGNGQERSTLAYSTDSAMTFSAQVEEGVLLVGGMLNDQSQSIVANLSAMPATTFSLRGTTSADGVWTIACSFGNYGVVEFKADTKGATTLVRTTLTPQSCQQVKAIPLYRALAGLGLRLGLTEARVWTPEEKRHYGQLLVVLGMFSTALERLPACTQG